MGSLRRSVAVVVLVLGAPVLVGCGGSAAPEAAAPAASSATDPESSQPSAAGSAEKSTASDEATSPGARSPAAASPTSTSAPSTSAPAPVPDTLEFTATTIDGDRFAGARLQGRPALLWFWAPWCPTCRSQVPEIERLAKTYGDDLQVVGVGSLDSATAISDYARQTRGFTAHLVDESGAVWKHFGITEQSSFVVLDAAGAETFRAGYGGSADLADEVADVVD